MNNKTIDYKYLTNELQWATEGDSAQKKKKKKRES